MKLHTNAQMNSRHIRRFCTIDAESGLLLERAMDRFGLSARAHARILKIARTIADLEGCTDIRSTHVAEAIQYRTLDRKMP
jgi:magnesium chelatase family protein